ncbi:MAG: hypothetical protein IKO27_01565 [Ruminococcus sp.]|nr:hypothetical protein [Ruminococcus sp.]
MADYKPDISVICRRAVALADGQGADFDYSPESISAMERLLAGQNALYKQGQLTDIYVWNLSVMFGVYLGQTMLRCGLADHGFHWITDSEGVPILYCGKEDYADVNGRVRARITGEDSENIRVFFEFVLDAADGMFDNIPKDGAKPLS